MNPITKVNNTHSTNFNGQFAIFKYRKDWDIYIPTDEGIDSDTTEVYWPLMDESSSEHAKLDPPPPFLLPLTLLDADQPLT